jgi:penicillin-binding protein 1A
VTHFSEIFTDKKIQLSNGKMWPPNYGGSVSGANYNLYYCLQRSLNTIPAQLVKRLGPQKVYDFSTQRLGLDLAPQDNDFAPLAIGSMTNGITLEDLVNAYIPYGNGGMFYDAHLISNVQEGNGELLYTNEGQGGVEAVDPDTAYVMNRMMNMVVNASSGTGTAAALKNKNVVGKTGTSDDVNDLLFVGLTEDFVSGIWLGFDHKHSMNSKAVSSPKMWKSIIGDFAETYNTGREYPVSDKVIVKPFCTVTGDIAGNNCPKSKINGYYKPSYAPVCDGNHEGASDDGDFWAGTTPVA